MLFKVEPKSAENVLYIAHHKLLESNYINDMYFFRLEARVFLLQTAALKFN